MSESIDAQCGRLMVEARERRGLSQEEVAVLMGTYQTRVSRWETGKVRVSVPDFSNWASKLSPPLSDKEWASFKDLGVDVAA